MQRLAQRIENIGERLHDAPLLVVAQFFQFLACHLAGDYRGTANVCRRLVQALQGERTHQRFGLVVFPAVQSRAFLARALAECGEFEEGDACGREAVRIAETLEHPFIILWACLGLAQLNAIKGELSQAASLLERAVALCHDWTVTVWAPIAMASLGHVYAWSGQLSEGITQLEQAVAAHESTGSAWFRSLSVLQLGEAYLLAGRAEDALACAHRALGLACDRGERGYKARALHLLGEIAARSSHPDATTAERHYAAALALASELCMRPLARVCGRW